MKEGTARYNRTAPIVSPDRMQPYTSLLSSIKAAHAQSSVYARLPTLTRRHLCLTSRVGRFVNPPPTILIQGIAPVISFIVRSISNGAGMLK